MKNIIVACVGLFSGVLLAAEPAKPDKGVAQTAGKPAQTKQAAKAAKSAKSAKSKDAAAPAQSEKMTFEKACEYITEVVKDPPLMGEITKQLNAEDQKKFLIEVNKAIVNMPGSNEQKTAVFMAVEREAFLAAAKGNLQALVAVSFATVPVEHQTVLAERYAEDLFNRSADATKTFTDEQFTEIASSTVKEVAKECNGMQDEPQRVTLAIWLFEKASNDTIPDLEDKLLEVGISDTATRETAKNEWLAEAKAASSEAKTAAGEKGENTSASSEEKFTSLLESANAGRAPNVDVVLDIAGPQLLSAQLNDLAQGVVDANGNQIFPVTQGENVTGRSTATANQIVQNITQGGAGSGTATQPKTGDPTSPYNPQYSREQVEEVKQIEEEYHPGGYQYQN